MNFIEDEKSLFDNVAQGDERSFANLFHLFLPKLHPIIIRLTRSETAVQEIIQETFIKVWLHRDKLTEIDNPGGWIFTIASNKCYDWLRAHSLQEKRILPETEHPDAGATNNVHEWLDSRELKNLIDQAVDQLPAQRKKIFLLSRHQGKTIPEIADILGVSPNTVKNALVIALRSIREYLTRHDVHYIFFTPIVLLPAAIV
jgi:RNA polymerase sigma-70 factor (ECF subfamily)